MWAECPLSPGGTGHSERDFPPRLTPPLTHSLPSRRPGLGPAGGPCRPAPSGPAWVPRPRWGSVSSEVGSAGPFWAAGVPLGGSCCLGLLSFSLDVQPRDVGRTQARPDPVLTVRPGWAGLHPPDSALRPGTDGWPQPRGGLALQYMLSPSTGFDGVARSSGRSGPAGACGGPGPGRWPLYLHDGPAGPCAPRTSRPRPPGRRCMSKPAAGVAAVLKQVLLGFPTSCRRHRTGCQEPGSRPCRGPSLGVPGRPVLGRPEETAAPPPPPRVGQRARLQGRVTFL